jgi:hypothetical protein
MTRRAGGKKGYIRKRLKGEKRLVGLFLKKNTNPAATVSLSGKGVVIN